MDNQPPQQNNVSPDSPTDSDPQPSQSNPSSGGGMKVLQPISSDLTPSSATPNIPTATTSGAASPEPAESVATSTPTNLPFNTPPSQPVPNSTYPDATHSTADTNTVKATDISNESDKTKVIVVCIWLIGAFISIPAALSLFGTAKILSYGISGGAGSIVTVINVVYLLIGVGIILRKEMARIAFVVLAVIGLLLSVYGTFNYFKAAHAVSNSESQAIVITQREITQYQNNKSIPDSQKQVIVSELKQTLAREEKAAHSTVKLYNLIPAYLIALIPLIFLTRPSVKEQFS